MFDKIKDTANSTIEKSKKATETSIKYGKKLKEPILEFYLKSDELNDPFMNNDHIYFLNIASENELKKIQNITCKINTLLKDFFNKIEVILVDFKLEFGRVNNQIILADEISPDSCRLWDKKTKKSFDKDVFRENKGPLPALIATPTTSLSTVLAALPIILI